MPKPSPNATPQPVPETPNGEGLGAGLPGQAVQSTELLKGHRAVAIVHNGTVYRLQSTRLGKLILTK